MATLIIKTTGTMKPEKTIHILGEDVKITFDMSVEIAYEEISGTPFNIEDLKTQKASLSLYMAAIIANNPQTEITVERLMKEATGHEIGLLGQTIIAAMTAWMAIPTAVIKEEQTKPKSEEEEEHSADGGLTPESKEEEQKN